MGINALFDYLYVYSFKFPIKYKSGEFKDFLTETLNDYTMNLVNISKSQNSLFQVFSARFPDIICFVRKACQAIQTSLDEYDNSNYSEAYRVIYKILDELHRWTGDEEKATVAFLGNINRDLFYRVRPANGKEFMDRYELFHVPFNTRHKISSSRFSLPGMPSLYLSGAPDLNYLNNTRTRIERRVFNL